MSVAAHVLVPTTVTTMVIPITIAVVIRIMTAAEVSVAAHVLVPTAVTTTIIRIMAAAAVVVLTYDVSLMTIVVRVVVATQNEVAPPEVDVS